MALQRPRWRGSRSPQASRCQVAWEANVTLSGRADLLRWIRPGSADGNRLPLIGNPRRDRTSPLAGPRGRVRLASGSSSWAASSGLPAPAWAAATTGPAATASGSPLSISRPLIEISHRWVAALVSLLVLAVTAVAWLRHRADPRFGTPPPLAGLVLLVVQVLLGAVTVKLELPPWVIIIHLRQRHAASRRAARAGAPRPGRAGAAPALRRASPGPPSRGHLGGPSASWSSCSAHRWPISRRTPLPGFPLCNGTLLPPASALAPLHWTHRLLAFAFRWSSWPWCSGRGCRRDWGGALARAAVFVLLTTLAQIVVAAAMVLISAATGASGGASPGGLPHLGRAGGAGVPSSRTRSGGLHSKVDRNTTRWRRPRHPHQAPDHLAAAGDDPRADVHHRRPASRPSRRSSGWLLGGYLMAGGANAINMWFDRDIDSTMSRTRLRPIPSGRISPPAGLGLRRRRSARAPLRSSGPRQPAQRVARARRAPVLRVRLHDLAQADEPAEHRHRRRSRRVPAAGGLGRDDRPARPRRGLSLRHHLLLDAAPLLGARADQAGRLRQGRHSDAAGGAGRGANQVRDAGRTR